LVRSVYQFNPSDTQRGSEIVGQAAGREALENQRAKNLIDYGSSAQYPARLSGLASVLEGRIPGMR
jgi:hypothetical protein